MNKIIVVFLVLAIAVAQCTVVEPCGGTAIQNLVNVEGCVDSVDGRCQFVKGKSYKISVDVKATSNATALHYTAKARMLGFFITLFKGNACEFLRVGNCPTQNGERIVFEKKITISDNYPALQSILKIQVKDETGALLLCAKIKFAIIKP